MVTQLHTRTVSLNLQFMNPLAPMALHACETDVSYTIRQDLEGSIPRRRRTGHRTGNYPVIIRKHLVRSQEWGTWTDPSTGAY